MYRLCVLVSGNGTTLQAIIDGVGAGLLTAEIAAVISSRLNAYALERARHHSIPAIAIDYRALGKENFNSRLLSELERLSPDLICLAGYLKILDGKIVRAYHGRILNIHPALLPQFGGKGMYGDRVHEAVLRSGARESGCTVHFVTEGVDNGPIILQIKVPVRDGDTVHSLGQRVHEAELAAYPEAIRLVMEGKAKMQ